MRRDAGPHRVGAVGSSSRTPSPALVTRLADGAVLASRCRVADRPPSRLRGLLARPALEPGEGLLIEPAASIHTLGMRFAIDALFLDRGGRVLRAVEGLAPWRVAGRRGARRVLELPVGTIASARIVHGDRLRVTPASDARGDQPPRSPG
jgi:uncharacterized membrane protein (UPF0127 family)